MGNKETKEVLTSSNERKVPVKKATESKLYALFLFAGIIAFWAIARKTIMPFIDDTIIPALHIKAFFLLSKNMGVNIILCILFTITTLFISSFLAQYIYDRAKSFSCSTLAVVSAYYIIYSYEWWQHKIGLPLLQMFDWVDIFNLVLLVFVIAWAVYVNQLYKFPFKLKDYLCNNKEEYYVIHNLKSDEPVEDEQDDRLNYKGLVKELAGKLNNTLPFQSISVAINGAWGVGKTSFVKLLKKELDRVMEDEHKHIVLEFNPRLSKAKETIQEDFFALLFSELAKYNSSFYTIGANYLKAIDVASQGFWWLGFLSFFKTGNRNKEWQKINEAVRSINKQIFIFIDDLDRLVGEEILEVFKIIGGNANFDNITFIVAFDKDYVHLNLNKIITNTDDSRGYPDKFFTVEQILPRLSRQQIQDVFEEFSPQGTFTRAVLTGVKDELLVKYFKTIRDVKRFLNFVQIELEEETLRRMLEILVPHEVFLRLLLKFKAPSTYDSLYEGSYFIAYYPQIHYPILSWSLKTDEILCYDILFEVFDQELPPNKEKGEFAGHIPNSNKYKMTHSIGREGGRWFYSYFVTRDKGSKYHINNRFGVPDIESLLEDVENLLQDGNYQSKFEELISKDEKGKELREDKQDKLWDIVDALSFEQYRRKWRRDYLKPFSYLLIFLHNIFGDYKFLDYLEEVLVEDGNNIGEDYKEFFKQTLIALNHKGSGESIFRRIIIGTMNNQWQGFTKIAKQGEFLDWAKISIIDRLKQDKAYIHQKHYEMLIACVKEKNLNGRYVLDEEVCQMVKDVVIQAPEDFANNLIVFWGLNLQFMPYFDELFGGEDKLIDYFKNRYTGIYRDRIKNFISLYEANNNRPIEVGGMEEKENLYNRMYNEKYDFKDEIKVLKRAKEIDGRVQKGLSLRELNRYYNEIHQMINKIEFPFLRETLKSIEEEMNKLRDS